MQSPLNKAIQSYGVDKVKNCLENSYKVFQNKEEYYKVIKAKKFDCEITSDLLKGYPLHNAEFAIEKYLYDIAKRNPKTVVHLHKNITDYAKNKIEIILKSDNVQFVEDLTNPFFVIVFRQGNHVLKYNYISLVRGELNKKLNGMGYNTVFVSKNIFN